MTAKTTDFSYLNSLSPDKAKEALFRCSGSAIWSDEMLSQSPFTDLADLRAKAEAAWKPLTKTDWLLAFKIHPKIGDKESLRQRFASTSNWASHEQSGTAHAGEEVLHALADGNVEYETKFGYIFIVCATGKSAQEMLTLLNERLQNDADTEFSIACGEQKKITALRLEKLHQ